jgi:hypothetical protein
MVHLGDEVTLQAAIIIRTVAVLVHRGIVCNQIKKSGEQNRNILYSSRY